MSRYPTLAALPLGEAALELAPRPLCRHSLRELPRPVRRPGFDLQALRPGILHFGCGAFHRAHQALITQHAIGAEMAGNLGPPPAWGIVAVNLRRPLTTQALRRQDGLYTVLERNASWTRAEVVGTLRRLVYAGEAGAPIAGWFDDPAIRIVTLTVTAAGYCLDPVTQRLDARHPDVQADLRGGVPRSTIGHLVAGLARRRARGLAPPVLLSCDNLPGNGHLLRRACADHAALHDDALAQWIERQVQFPNTVVDRIVPTASAADGVDALEILGLDDAMPVSAEPYRQWVIEAFDGARPRWDEVGVEFVTDVAPWEASKLRLLNGGHLALSYLGLLEGVETVTGALRRPGVVPFLSSFLLDEQRPTLPPGGHDIPAYARQLIERWRNPAIVHRLDRIARDGTGKLAARLLAALRINLREGRAAPCTVLAVAAWLQCMTGRDRHGREIRLQDSLAPAARRLGWPVLGDPAALVTRMLGWHEVFGDELQHRPRLRLDLTAALVSLQTVGVGASIARCLSGVPW